MCFPSFTHCLLYTGNVTQCKLTSSSDDGTVYWDSGKRHNVLGLLSYDAPDGDFVYDKLKSWDNDKKRDTGDFDDGRRVVWGNGRKRDNGNFD